MQWQVEHALTPPQAWSISMPWAKAMSKMLPGKPVTPYGIFSGSTSTTTFIGMNVIVNF
jgi:hypothetical protein